ncbi:GNAT family N-acetyltransferase [Acidaminobacter sp. JC074]|uniref:GNAT family N-acetyltransferase n=1 Tax=Acidaminobacter sp. JC074 TaxID=2530199 RepID=UPI001F10A01B|nr:GNAT family N-acetyltransferase [Acidaminobacter sp. JC074]
MLDKNIIKSQIDKVSSEWDISGNFIITKQDQVLHKEVYGYRNRDKNQKATDQTRYTLDSNEKFFVNLALVSAIDRKLLNLSDTLDKFVADFKHGSKITIEHLLKDLTGLSDFYFEGLMVDLENDQAYHDLSFEDRLRREQRVYFENRDFDSVMKRIKSIDLVATPGDVEGEDSKTNEVMLIEILRQVTGLSVFDYLKEYIFLPLGMTVNEGHDPNTLSYRVHDGKHLVSIPLDYKASGLFNVSGDDISKLLMAISKKDLYSKAMWKKILKRDAYGNNLLFYNANGYDCSNTECLGFGFYPYFDFESGLGFASLVNEHQTFKHVEGAMHYFRRDSREVVSSLTTYPEHTKMVALSKKHFWHAINLEIEEDQRRFVFDTKGSIAMALMYPTKKAFLQMEGNTIVGLLVLEINKKKGDFDIDIIIIDKKYQGRGYGKLMVKWAVEKLKSEGAKKLTIGVNKQNLGAKKIYMNAGFKPSSVGQGGMQLSMEIK